MMILRAIAVVMISAAPAWAQHSHANHGGIEVLETGQAQFASIAVIVAVLRDDPDTNWDHVDIQALRDHLVDMDNVTRRSVVAVKEEGTRVIFTITGDAVVAASIRKMVIAHSPMLEAETGWSVASETILNGATMTIAVADGAERSQLLGLGFHGAMTIGAHHQRHHMMIAKGRSPH